jgi:molecular chaperone HscA
MSLLNIEEPGNTPLPHEQKDETAIGIDLGTTNSLVSIKEGENITVIGDKDGNLIHPSIVSFGKNGEIKCAHEALKTQNSTKVFSIKRLMDENSLKKNPDIAKNFPHKIIQNDGESLKVEIQNKQLTPTEISSYLLRYLKEIASEYLNQDVKKAVITVPAYFDEAARNATKNAALLAGLEVLRLINEPTSAAISYGLDNGSKGTFAIFDLGGGTFDISILKLHQGVFKVIGVSGNSALGGDDIDHIILDEIINKCDISNLDDSQKQNLRLISKEIKESFTSLDKIDQEFEVSDKKYQFSLTKKEFNALISDFVQKTIKITNHLIEDLEIDEDDIKGIVLVGGSTRTDLIQEKLADIFGKNKILTNLDPDKVVGIGAAIQAHGLTHGSSDLLLDVVPLSLGIETMGGIVEKIIERNSTIPTSYSKEFTTYADNQNGMKLHILQGERELIEDCRSLAKFKIKNIPALKAGVARVKVTFTIDADGLLTVSAKEESTNQTQIIEVKPTYGLNEIAMKEMLIDSARNAKTDIQKRLLAETKSEATRNILAITGALKEDGDLLKEQEIKNIKSQIETVEKSLKTDNKILIEKEAENLENLAKHFAEVKMDKYVRQELLSKKIEEI